jgi:hypothetical protein
MKTKIITVKQMNST